MSISFIIKMKILMPIKWSYMSPQWWWPWLPEMATIVWTHMPIFFKHKSFWYPFLEEHQPQILLKHRCPIKRNNRIRHVHLSTVYFIFKTNFILFEFNHGLHGKKHMMPHSHIPIIRSRQSGNITSYTRAYGMHIEYESLHGKYTSQWILQADRSASPKWFKLIQVSKGFQKLTLDNLKSKAL